jgi:hypothetical protein
MIAAGGGGHPLVASFAQQAAEELIDSSKDGVPTPLSSFPQEQESSYFKGLWTPALRFAAAGMTVFDRRGRFSAAC